MHHTQTFGFATVALGDVAFSQATKLLAEMSPLPPVQEDGSSPDRGYMIVVTAALFDQAGICLRLVTSASYGHKYEDDATKLQVVGRDALERCLKPQSVARAYAVCSIRLRTQLIPISQVADLLWNQSA